MLFLEAIIGLSISALAFWLIMKLYNFLLYTENKVINAIIGFFGPAIVVHAARDAKRWFDKK